MGNYLFILPLVATIAALCFGFVARSILLKRAPALFNRLAPTITGDIFSAEDIRLTMAGKVNPLDLLPLIEEHIDGFLRHRLGKAIPMVGMFIGDRTISEMKNVFMLELTDILPQVLDKYAGDMASKLDVGEIVNKKLVAVPPEKLTAAFNKSMHRELVMIPLWAGAAGLLIGLIQCFVMLLIS